MKMFTMKSSLHDYVQYRVDHKKVFLFEMTLIEEYRYFENSSNSLSSLQYNYTVSSPYFRNDQG